MSEAIKFFLCFVLFFSLTYCAIDSKAGVRRSENCDAKNITDRFDNDFFQSVRRYWPQNYNQNWCLMKAQCVAESNLVPDAESVAGAVGLCQILKSTFSDVSRRIDLRNLGRRNPAANVAAGSYYMSQMIRIWQAPRGKACRIELAWASYNAGAGNIISAQKESGGRRCWIHISPHLPSVTGLKNSAETQGYVSRIWQIFRRLKGVEL